MRRLVLCLAVVLTPAAAFASDIAERKPLALPALPHPAAPDPGWTGFYAGVQGGYGLGDSSGTQNAGGTFFPVVPYSIDPRGFIGGGHAGYNTQLGRVVYGIEGDIEAANISGMTTVSTAGQTYFFNLHARMLASLRGRIGIAHDNWLFYGTGGVAWGNITAPPLNALSDTRTGWAVGAGIERAINASWSARLEYRYTDFGRVSAAGGEVGATDDNSFAFHAIRVGLTYRFH